MMGFQKKFGLGIGGWGELYPVLFLIFLTLQSPNHNIYIMNVKFSDPQK